MADELGASRPKRILMLSVSAGAGHVRAAEALREQAAIDHAGVTATHWDVMDLVPAWFRRLYTDLYIYLANRHPAVWSYLYAATETAHPDSMSQRLRRCLERACTRRLRNSVASFKPDAIVCTHFLPAEILARMTRESRLSCPVWVQVTDFDLHRIWVQKEIAGYFSANEEVAFRMRAHGIPSHTIHVTGIPIMPVFGNVYRRDECAEELGLDPACMTILLMGGGAGLGSLDAIAKHLLQMEAGFQLIALAGKNSRMLAALQELALHYPGRLWPQGFTNRVERLMACADLAVTKPGGLTISECLAMGLPMIVNSPIPGQEERNADFLLEQGVALKACNLVTLEYRVRYLLQHSAMLNAMREKARALGRATAARKVLEIILKH